MIIRKIPTYKVQIYTAADFKKAKEVCREFCFENTLCVTVQKTNFIYKGGEESGVVVELVNYPRFPTSPESLFEKATLLANELMTYCCQESFLITDDKQTLWTSIRASHHGVDSSACNLPGETIGQGQKIS